MSQILSSSRYLIIVAVVGSFLASVALLVYGGVEVVTLIVETAIEADISTKGAKKLVLAFIEVVDLFLLSTVLYIIALGLYELFIDDNVAVPDWLTIHNLDDLKEKLIGVIIVVLGVLFLGQVITWDNERDLLNFGAAIALVVAALAYFLSLKKKAKSDGEK